MNHPGTSHLVRALTALAAATVAIMGLDGLTYAATGSSLILGAKNTAETITILKRTTDGPPLRLKAVSTSAAPLETTATGRVVNLNADSVDGLSSEDLQTSTSLFSRSVTNATSLEASLELPVPSGTYVVGYSIQLTASSSVSGGQLRCFVKLDPTSGSGTPTILGPSSTATLAGAPAAVSGSAVVTVDDDHALSVVCSAPGTGWSTFGAIPFQAYATRTAVS